MLKIPFHDTKTPAHWLSKTNSYAIFLLSTCFILHIIPLLRQKFDCQVFSVKTEINVAVRHARKTDSSGNSEKLTR